MSYRLTGLCLLILAATALAMGMAFAQPAAKSLPRESYETDCEAGKASSCAFLAIRYRHGRGLRRDPVKAYAYAKKGCEAGSDFACGYAGDMLYRGLGAKQDKAEGARMMRAACRKGERWSCDALRSHGLAKNAAAAVSVSER